MRKIYFALAIVFILQSCRQNSSENTSDISIEDQWQEVKKTADLRIYELFLIEHPNTDLFPEILDSIQVAWEILLSESNIPYCRGHCFRLLINNEGELLFDSKLIDDKDLIATIKEVLLFPEKTGRFSIEETLGWKVKTRPFPIKGIIELKGDEALNPKRYAEVLKFVKLGYASVRHDYAKIIFQKSYDELTKIESDSIQKLVPFRIGFEKYIPVPPPPPGD